MPKCFRMWCCSVVAFAMVAVSGCGSNSADPMLSGRIGDRCTVYFRRDALGMAAASPSSPTTGNHNGADTCVAGKLVRVNAEWVAVSVEKREFSVPKSAILMVEVEGK
jgi:hypothetical protein